MPGSSISATDPAADPTTGPAVTDPGGVPAAPLLQEAAPPPPGQDPRPQVSVLMAVHDGATFLEEAMASITGQSLREIEIVVVDDCSTDATPAILARLAAADPRIRILTAPENLKLPGALNLGLAHVRAPLIARMDDDDIAHPRRLEIQKAYLDAHPGITLVGSSFQRIRGDGTSLRTTVRSRDSLAIRWALRFSPNVSHPTFMFRRTLPGGANIAYDPAYQVAQDFDLLCRLAYAGAETAILPDVLLRYRVHEKSASLTRRQAQDEAARRLGTEYQRRTLPAPVFAAMQPFRECFFDFAPATPERIAGAFAGARALLAHDIAATSGRAAWLRRQTSQYLAWALQRGGLSAPRMAASFLRHGPGLMPPMALRALETKGYLPRGLRSDPDIWPARAIQPAT